MKIDGACHCGAVRFVARVSPRLVSLCHCTDCQTMSGAPYRVNVPALHANFDLHGDPKRYVKIGSSGECVTTAFCGECGSPIFSSKEGGDHVNIRIGVVSQRAALAPLRQGFCGAALPWAFDITAVQRAP
ncbi:MAG: GFA family protein [Hyphomonadaceae bacterium]|nr:GFA family protein [Hyphomonadaceae bacterium]